MMMETQFQCHNGRTVTIKIDDEDGFRTNVFDENHNNLGRFEFNEVDNSLRLVWAHLNLTDNTWRRQGIGRRILQEVQEFSGFFITASDDDGMQHDDGSHLTGDAPAFVAKMREEGLIQPGFNDSWDENE